MQSKKVNRLDRVRSRRTVRPAARQIRPIEEAVLRVLPTHRTGLSFDELVDDVARRVNPMVFPLRRQVSRLTKIVQLELEQRGLIERIPGVTPLRLRRRK